ncbi:hypothetical protein CFC35_15535 [Streptomyces sp. FBKL.4005]|uniref:hypothetical protein n=1 Tax=Streptomyces sp. FBKL.4005 TaxID=2015515 RepID=UPI000B962486|nr:hypothetical protein [Streptomyces sp. FBKL.4005]OYP15741.1 hypothetical protein CFC35_15535 [Streptomyces sp. FBKL.4005]
MSPRAGQAGHPARTLAFVESPVQLLNVLEWAHLHGLRDGAGPTHRTATPPTATPPTATPPTATDPTATPRTAPGAADRSGPAEPPGPAGAQLTGGTSTGSSAAAGPSAGFSAASGPAGGPSADAELTVVVLSPTDPMTRGQLRRMADLARDEGHRVRWEEARGGTTAPFHTIGGLAGPLRRADRIVMGDPFSRYVQLLLTITRAHDLVVVDDGTATMEFVAQLARGERLVRWHRKGGRPGPRDLLFAPVSSSARRRLTPSDRRRVEVFSSMPVTEIPDGVTVTANDFAWTRARFGPPRITQSADLVGTSLVETGVVDGDRYLEAVRNLAKAHGATRYFAHRRESTEKLHRLAVETGLEIVRPDLPLELIARRGPIGRTILSFPSTVVHTLPLALAGTGVRVAVCDIDPTWLTDTASPRAQGFLSGVTGTARDVHRLAAVSLA